MQSFPVFMLAPMVRGGCRGIRCDITNLTDVTYQLHLPRRTPRINGDTRRRKRRLRDKIAKRDKATYAGVMRWASALIRDGVVRAIERGLFDGPMYDSEQTNSESWRDAIHVPFESCEH